MNSALKTPASSLPSSYSLQSSITKEDDEEESAPLVLHSQHLLKPNGCILGKDVGKAILPRFDSLLSAIPLHDRPALSCIDGRQALCSKEIVDFCGSFGESLHQHNVGRGHRIAVVLPNGPELALALVAVGTWACGVPLNAHGAVKELALDLEAAACDLVIGLEETVGPLARDLKIPFCALEKDNQFAGRFTLKFHGTVKPPKNKHPVQGSRLAPNTHPDQVLVLFTSGTTGSKKLVPHTLGDLLISTACICVSWKLRPSDTNCNLMPLFHVGGIIRQVFSPILSGGCVICCPSFDPNIFWTLLQQQRFTWYYAAPTMHQLILQTGYAEDYIHRRSTKKSPRPRHLRMIANAAGGLLPSLARELQQAFGACVLPSYGMTECMPISSPPSTYQLEKTGTSGVAVGPELAILNMETMERLQTGKEGPICVRHEPCFRGYGALYEGSPKEQPASDTFQKDGWFFTGDLGYMDADGYLYITGRSKEVINRGGEIISPLEVEEAVNGHANVKQAIAFSAKHSILQEVVGIVLVTQGPRPDLVALHEYLQGRLAAPKWPQCIVYMDALPKSNTNKLLRVKLGQRLGLPEMHDNMNVVERTFQATCPAVGTPVSVAISCERVQVNADHVASILQETLVKEPSQFIAVVPHPTRLGSLVAHVVKVNRLDLIRVAQERLDAYLVPSHVVEMTQVFTSELDLMPPEPEHAVAFILQEASSAGKGPTDAIVLSLQELFQDLLDLDCLPAPATNFFNLGGSSMLASQLASKIRKIHSVPFGGAEVFHYPDCEAIASLIRERKDETTTIATENMSKASSLFAKTLDLKGLPFAQNRMDSYSDCKATFLQMIPILIILPLWELSRSFLYFRMLMLVLYRHERGKYHFLLLGVTLSLFHLLWLTITPLIFVAVKWVVIGKYRAGRYPLWKSDYLRWWFVDVVRRMIGKGIWASTEPSLNFYYRLLGAKIGKDAHIAHDAEIAEYDLVTIGDGAVVEHATVRGFGCDNGAMVLGPVAVGEFGSVGLHSVVAPHTSIPAGTHLGAACSSYEITSAHMGKQIEHLRVNRSALPAPNMWWQMFICNPLLFVVEVISQLPALAVLIVLIHMPWRKGSVRTTVGDLMEWLSDVRRIPFYIGIKLARAILTPLVRMLVSIVIKRLIIGRFQPGPRDVTNQWQLSRHFLVSNMFSRYKMQTVCELIGRHYQMVSWLYRALGAKVGERVFWPGQQPIVSGEFDLLEIGDDVVLGSRACMFHATTDSCEKVVLCAGSNVSDNVIVLPGGVLGRNACLGSNAVCPSGHYLPESSLWFGSRLGDPVMLEKGIDDQEEPVPVEKIRPEQIVLKGDESTLRPFGRAYYQRKTSYFVLPWAFMVSFAWLCKIVNTLVHTLPLLGALHCSAAFLYGPDRNYEDPSKSFAGLYLTMLCFYILLNLIRIFLWIMIELISKKVLIGLRQPGRFQFDESSYNQRWELYQHAISVREIGKLTMLDFIGGTPFIATFFRLLGCKVGRDCCLYPHGGDPYMSEPDLVEYGDRCVLDTASAVCHLNTRGNFELKRIKVGNNVTLRCRSRIQQGVQMENNSMVLEKGLVLTGEIVEADSVWQGAPAARLFSYDTSSITSMNSVQSGAFV